MPIRIVLGWMPRLVGDIVEGAVMVEPDMLIVGRVHGQAEALAVVRRGCAEILIRCEPEAGGGLEVLELLGEHASVKVMTVAKDARRARLYELRETEVPDVSPRGLVAAIRQAVSATADDH